MTERTGYYIRARDVSGGWHNRDIAELTDPQINDLLVAMRHNQEQAIVWLGVALTELRQAYNKLEEAQNE